MKAKSSSLQVPRSELFNFHDSAGGDTGIGDAERALVLRLAMKCCDFSHAFQSFEQHKLWSERVVEEFCQQGDKELLEGYTPAGLFDRKSLSPVSMAKNQAAFLDIIVIPLFELMAELLPATTPMLEQIRTNSSCWKNQASLRTSSITL